MKTPCSMIADDRSFGEQGTLMCGLFKDMQLWSSKIEKTIRSTSLNGKLLLVHEHPEFLT
jgi:hypothetical protein